MLTLESALHLSSTAARIVPLGGVSAAQRIDEPPHREHHLGERSPSAHLAHRRRDAPVSGVTASRRHTPLGAPLRTRTAGRPRLRRILTPLAVTTTAVASVVVGALQLTAADAATGTLLSQGRPALA